MLAPTVGGYVTEYYGWHVVFYTDVHGILILFAAEIGFTYYFKAGYFYFIK
jgi:DHA1 family bicyclomycin/chloramphenicol resistance-like MFS transporter